MEMDGVVRDSFLFMAFPSEGRNNWHELYDVVCASRWKLMKILSKEFSTGYKFTFENSSIQRLTGTTIKTHLELISSLTLVIFHNNKKTNITKDE